MTEKLKPADTVLWEPKTTLGRRVKAGEITTLEQALESGSAILEEEIVDVLIPNLEAETLEVRSTQRVTDSGKRTQFRVVVVVGDRKGHVAVGVGKNAEMRPAVELAVRNAKKNMISVTTGCGSWECKCTIAHSLPRKVVGKEGSTVVAIKPAPRGLGLAANGVVKKVLYLAGVKDVWGFSCGGRNTYNTAQATINSLRSLSTLKPLPPQVNK